MLRSIVLSMLGVFVTAMQLQAAFTYSFQLDQASYLNQAANSVINTGVFLVETRLASDPASTWNGASGVIFNVNSVGGTTVIASAAGNAAFGFSGANATAGAFPTATGVQIQNLSFAAPPGFSAITNVNATTRRMQVGSLTLNTGSGGTSNITFADPSVGNNVGLYFGADVNPISMDALAFGGSTTIAVSVNAVPEPSSMALMGLAGLGACVVRKVRAKRKNNQVA